MNKSSIDLSNKPDLQWLAVLVRAIERAMGGRNFFIAGAQARDLLLTHQHGIEIGRATTDIDFAVMVESWQQFNEIRDQLIASREFRPADDNVHRIFFGEIAVDIIPFGGVENVDRSIAWPPKGEEVMTTLGFAEALGQCEWVALPTGVEVRVASIPAQALLKLVAWSQGKRDRGSKDAQDFRTLANAYSRIERDRLFAHSQLFDRSEFDVDAAGAWLLGFDAARAHAAYVGRPDEPHPRRSHAGLLSEVTAIVDRETDSAGRLTLVSSMGGNSIDENMKLLTWFRDGLRGRS